MINISYNVVGDFMKYFFQSFQYETNDENKYNDFIEELVIDSQIKRFIPRIKSLSKKMNQKSIYDNSYIVKDIYSNALIGYVHLFSPSIDEISLVYAVHPDFRGLGYGKGILSSTTEFILKNNININKIELIIHPDNFISACTAVSSGYVKESGIRYIKKR